MFSMNQGVENQLTEARETHQALINHLSNVRSHTPVLQHLFVDVLLYQIICTC